MEEEQSSVHKSFTRWYVVVTLPSAGGAPVPKGPIAQYGHPEAALLQRLPFFRANSRGDYGADNLTDGPLRSQPRHGTFNGQRWNDLRDRLVP